ncbi:hypothetical protein BDK51DRAFT_32761 [Blyttiomyces helicus]|uniref:Peptidase A1 domain-containing protein n=1 Tax=Blyttiomyces helicus TaxID=388810 RepID=A0A4P9VW41_9FUNG|nr:hypothetical protein BDK51DRAFT_32761 [Blyttiomyces helicus]|eukprot:RKO83904.1 hypothetical protein BDK51DRAFT_32761 [Blyttiomyces helicus]
MLKQTILLGLCVCMTVDAAPRRHRTFNPLVAKAIAPLKNNELDLFYTVDVTIGTGAHATTLSFDLDTGSPTFWFDGSLVHPRSYRNTTQEFSVHYMDGTGVSGHVYCGGVGSSQLQHSGLIGLMRLVENTKLVDASFLKPLNIKSFGIYLSHVKDRKIVGTFSIDGIDPSHVIR